MPVTNSLRLLTSLLALSLIFASASQLAYAVTFPARIELGSGAGQFFDPASGFTDGVDTSHTNAFSFNDGVVQMDLTLTIEALGVGGIAVPINVTPSAAGIQELNASDDNINAGESLVVTYDSIVFSAIGAPAEGIVDLTSRQALLSSIRLSAFDDGVDSFLYSGVGAPPTTSIEPAGRIATLDFGASIQDGDAFTIEGGPNSAFRALFISNRGSYEIIPEPTTFALLIMGLAGSMATWLGVESDS